MEINNIWEKSVRQLSIGGLILIILLIAFLGRGSSEVKEVRIACSYGYSTPWYKGDSFSGRVHGLGILNGGVVIHTPVQRERAVHYKMAPGEVCKEESRIREITSKDKGK